MTAVPLSLPGMLPPTGALPGAQTLPGTVPTPHDPSADPFLALLTQLVTPAGTPAAAPVPAEGEVPTDEPADLPADLPAEAPGPGVPTHVAETEEEPDAEDVPAEDASPGVDVPALPVAAQLPAIVPPRPSEVPGTTVGTTIEARTEARTEGPVAVPTLAPNAPEAPAPAMATPPTVTAPVSALTNRSGSAETPAPEAVTRQVFPEVVRAAVTGVTPNRVVVRLAPEHLGEVRVVLRTDPSGTLEVSLAGGPEARAAMREGAPELRRLLEAAGSHDAKVVVRHLAADAATTTTPVAPATSTTTVRTDVPTTAGGLPVDVGAGTAGGTAPGTSQGEERRERDPQDARPGATDGYPDRSAESTAHLRGPAGPRAGGLDVMM